MRKDQYKIALSLLYGIGPIKTKTLVARCGGLEAIFSNSDQALAEISGLTLSRVKRFNRKAALKRAEQELLFIEKNGIKLHYYQDAGYPPLLKFCEDGPIVLYSKGNISFNTKNTAVVGTRKASGYGKKTTQQLIRDLAPYQTQIISGLAHGIDKAAHEAALVNNLSTIGVLGHGLDLIYPAAHRKLAERMLENGGLVTEFISGTPGDPSNFPQRNRIVAGLSDATVVIESAATGGSLITAGMAFDYDRPVFAFPGHINHLYSTGCNRLIQQQKAALITSADDLIAEMGWEEIEASEEVVQSDLFDALNVAENRLLTTIKSFNKVHIDHLVTKTDADSDDGLSIHLFNLEMRGAIESLPGNFYMAV